jgi:hypothetical protein
MLAPCHGVLLLLRQTFPALADRRLFGSDGVAELPFDGSGNHPFGDFIG